MKKLWKREKSIERRSMRSVRYEQAGRGRSKSCRREEGAAQRELLPGPVVLIEAGSNSKSRGLRGLFKAVVSAMNYAGSIKTEDLHAVGKTRKAADRIPYICTEAQRNITVHTER